MDNIRVMIRRSPFLDETVVVNVDRIADFGDERALMGAIEQAANNFDHIEINTSNRVLIALVCRKADDLRASGCNYTHKFTQSGVSFKFYNPAKRLKGPWEDNPKGKYALTCDAGEYLFDTKDDVVAVVKLLRKLGKAASWENAQ